MPIRLNLDNPSRMIVVRLKDGEDELAARVSAQCWKPFGHQRQICCEYVEVTASINRLADAASIVAPLAAPDLPRVVLLRSARIVRAGLRASGDRLSFRPQVGPKSSRNQQQQIMMGSGQREIDRDRHRTREGL